MKNSTYFTSNDVIGALKSINRMSCSLGHSGSDGAKLPVVVPVGDYLAHSTVSEKEQMQWFYVTDEEVNLQNWYSISIANGAEVIIGKN